LSEQCSVTECSSLLSFSFSLFLFTFDLLVESPPPADFVSFLILVAVSLFTPPPSFPDSLSLFLSILDSLIVDDTGATDDDESSFFGFFSFFL